MLQVQIIYNIPKNMSLFCHFQILFNFLDRTPFNLALLILYQGKNSSI